MFRACPTCTQALTRYPPSPPPFSRPCRWFCTRCSLIKYGRHGWRCHLSKEEERIHPKDYYFPITQQVQVFCGVKLSHFNLVSRHQLGQSIVVGLPAVLVELVIDFAYERRYQHRCKWAKPTLERRRG